MRDFIINGYVKVKVDFPPSFHDTDTAISTNRAAKVRIFIKIVMQGTDRLNVYQQLDAMFEGTGNLGNNVLPLIPEIQEIFDHPLVHGAMQGVLGENYAMHSHRYCHFNQQGSEGQDFHKDSYEGDGQIRRVGTGVVGRWRSIIRRMSQRIWDPPLCYPGRSIMRPVRAHINSPTSHLLGKRGR
jgi:hypothetical protein